jgi:hypothetical protein
MLNRAVLANAVHLTDVARGPQQSLSSQSSMLFDYAANASSAVMDTVMSESQRDIDEVR